MGSNVSGAHIFALAVRQGLCAVRIRMFRHTALASLTQQVALARGLLRKHLSPSKQHRSVQFCTHMAAAVFNVDPQFALLFDAANDDADGDGKYK